MSICSWYHPVLAKFNFTALPQVVQSSKWLFTPLPPLQTSKVLFGKNFPNCMQSKIFNTSFNCLDFLSKILLLYYASQILDKYLTLDRAYLFYNFWIFCYKLRGQINPQYRRWRGNSFFFVIRNLFQSTILYIKVPP